MSSTQAIIKIPADMFQSLDDFHKAISLALVKKGRVLIDEGAGTNNDAPAKVKAS